MLNFVKNIFNEDVDSSEFFDRYVFAKLKIFFLLVMGPAFWLLISCYSELSSFGFAYFLFGFLFNTLFQCLVLYFVIVFIFYRFRWLVIPVLLLLVVVNFRFNVICLVSLSFNQKLLITIFFSLIVFCSFFFESGLKFAAFFSLFFVAQSLFNLSQVKGNPQAEDIRKPLQLKEKQNYVHRNIYFLGLDSLPGDRYYERNFDERAVWSNLFIGEGFRKINNAFTGGATSTRNFYLNLFSFSDQGHYFQSRNLLNRPLRLYDLMKAEGYRSQFMFHSYWLGSGKNEYFDYNYPTNELSDTACPFLTPYVGFYLCHEKVARFIEGIYRWNSEGKEFSGSSIVATPVDLSIKNMMPVLMDRIKVAASDSVPWVSVFHLWEPGHTTTDYRHNIDTKKNEFKKIFRHRAINATNDAMKIISEIKKVDPNAVIIISGDHGPRLTEGWELDSSIRMLFSVSERLEDTQGIGFFIYPKDFCEDKIKDGYLSYFLFKDVFDCLSGRSKVH